MQTSRPQGLSALATRWFGRLRSRKTQLALAVRITVAAVAAFAIASALHLMLPLWAVLTSLIVTQLSVGRSLKVSRDYLFGTVGGALYGGAIAVLIPHSGELELLALLALAVGPLAFLAAIKPSLNTAVVTSIIVLLLPEMRHAPALSSAVDRVLEVGVGAITGLLVSFLVLPSRAQEQMRANAARVFELIAAALAELLAGLSGGRDVEALHRIQDGIGAAVVELNAMGVEAQRERAAHLSSGPDTGPLLRTILRLRHDAVMIGRATVVPLPFELQARLAPAIAGVSSAISAYLRSCATALRSGAEPPPMAAVETTIAAYAAEVAAVRGEGLTRGLPGDATERFYALGFSLEQMRQNLIDLERVVAEWSNTPPAVPEPTK